MYPAVFKSFIEQYLLQKLQVPIDLNNITPVRTESVDTKLRVLFSDLIFELKTFSYTTIYLLFEHKSYPDSNIEKQLIKYMDTFELDYLKEHSEAKTSLNMIPVLIYHGVDTLNIEFHNSRVADLMFFDLSRMPDEKIRGTVILRIVLLTIKYIRSEELVTKIDMILELFKELKDDPEAKEYARSFSFYVEHAAREELKEMLEQKIRHFFTDEELESSTVVRELEERGKKKGIDIGKKKGIDIGKKEGIDIGKKEGIDIGKKEGIDIGTEATILILKTNKSDEQIAKDTGLPVEKIRELRKKNRTIH